LVDALVVRRHALDGEAGLERRPAGRPIDLLDLPGPRDGLVERAAHEAGHPVVDDLRNRTARHRDDGRATRQGLDEDQAERLGPVDREQERAGAGQELLLAAIVDLADKLAPVAEAWGDDVLVVSLVGWVHLGRDAKREADLARDRECPIEALLRRDPADE